MALVACVLVAGLLVAVLNGCSDGDELWERLRQETRDADIVSAELRADGSKTTVLVGPECEAAVDAFVSGVFDEDNPDFGGPTAAVVVLFHYADGRVLTPNQWPDGRFEVRYGERQFLVRCPELEALLKERGFVYE